VLLVVGVALPASSGAYDASARGAPTDEQIERAIQAIEELTNHGEWTRRSQAVR